MADITTLDTSRPMRWGILRGVLAGYWFSFLFTTALLIGCGVAAGATLGLLLGGMVVATTVTPGAVLAERSWFGRGVAWAGVVDAALLVWLWPVFAGVISFGDWVEAMLVVVAYSAAAGGVACALHEIGVRAVPAAAVTVVMGVAWLSWPVWLAPWLSGENRETVVAWLVWAHPVFALNGATLEAWGVPWAQMKIAYQLTNIGDDIGYEMPRSVWACAGMHAMIAALVTAAQWGWRRRWRGDRRGG